MMFTPKSKDALEKAVKKRELLESGSYLAELLGVEERRSKAGNDMFVVTVGIGEHEIIDYLPPRNDQAALRLRNLCSACSPEVVALFDAGSLSASDFPAAGTPLRVDVAVEKARKGYPARNSVEDYSAAEVSGVVTPLRAAG